MIAILDRFVAKCEMSINILSNDTMYISLPPEINKNRPLERKLEATNIFFTFT